jgi:hypothetical protein
MHASKHADALRSCLRANGNAGVAASWAANIVSLRQAVVRRRKETDMAAIVAVSRALVRLSLDLWKSRSTLEAMTSPRCLPSYIEFVHFGQLRTLSLLEDNDAQLAEMAAFLDKKKAARAAQRDPRNPAHAGAR